ATDQGSLWEEEIGFTVRAPEILLAGFTVDDSAGGNGNGTLEPGETVLVTVTLENQGSYGLDGVGGVLTCGHPQVHILADAGARASLAPGEAGPLEPPFELFVEAECPLHLLLAELLVSGANGYEQRLELPLRIGEYFEDVETGAGDWDHYAVSDGFGDAWHISQWRNHSPAGVQSWRCGTPGDSVYAAFLDAALISPPIEIGPGALLRFWSWIDAETALTWPDSAYDGGLVEISIDGGPFEQISPVGGYPYTIKLRSEPDQGPFPHGTPVFGGRADWRQHSFELGSRWGSAVFRFRFGSDERDAGAGAFEGWYIDDVEVIGLGAPSGAQEVELTPASAILRQNAPNPFSAHTRIAFALPARQQVTLRIFDTQGRLVRTLLQRACEPGQQAVVWDGRCDRGHLAASGVYCYRLEVGEAEGEGGAPHAGGTRVRRCILLR
ncbi:MAG: hypothetical protein GF330_00810, partial [Candidatus Eisenbacteria bacterium]|nr:hypothetical protein [Candidatus Eisenbacteria bacterium]